MPREEIKMLYRNEKNRTRVMYRVLKYLKYSNLKEVLEICFDIAPAFVTPECPDWTTVWYDALEILKEKGYVKESGTNELVVIK